MRQVAYERQMKRSVCYYEITVMILDKMYVSVLPCLLPDTNSRLTDEEKRRDFDNVRIGPPSVSLLEFLKGDLKTKRLCDRIRSIRNEQSRKAFVAGRMPHAIIPVKVWTRDFSLAPGKFVKAYNGLVVLEFPIDDDMARIESVLKSKPWVLYVTLSADGDSVIAIVPVDNDDYRRHDLFFKAVSDELRHCGLVADGSCDGLTAMMARTFDDDAWYNEVCELFELPRQSASD